MDFSPRIQRLIAKIEAVQLKADCSAAKLAAEVRQVLLATTVDIEQRWQFLTPEDRVDVLYDLIALTVVYQRAFGDEVTPTEVLTQTVGKVLSEQSYPVDQAALATGLQADDVATAMDVYARVVDYARSPEDVVEMVDAIETLLSIVRTYSDNFAAIDLAAKSPTKVVEDLGGLYVEAGYFADDYWQAAGITPYDASTLTIGKSADEPVPLTDLLALVAVYVRTYADSTALTEVVALDTQLDRTDALTTLDGTALSLDLACAETAVTVDEATLDFATQIQELVVAAEGFARLVGFSRTATDTTALTDTTTKALTTVLSDIGGLYATVDYFADDYVAVGTGPAVYDTFSYTLA